MQTILIFVLFTLAVGYLGWRAYRRWAVKDAGCGKGCGCAVDTKQGAVRREQLTTNGQR